MLPVKPFHTGGTNRTKARIPGAKTSAGRLGSSNLPGVEAILANHRTMRVADEIRNSLTYPDAMLAKY